MAVRALLLEECSLDRAEFERAVRLTSPVAGSHADAQECVCEAQFEIIAKRPDNVGSIFNLIVDISRKRAATMHRHRRRHPQFSLEAFEMLPAAVAKRSKGTSQDPRTFFLWPGCDSHVDMLAIGEDDSERHRLGLEIANLQARGETDYTGLHRSFREWTREEVLEVVREYAEEKGSAPTAADLERHDSLPTRTVIYKYFLTWNAALEAAGLEPKRGSYLRSRWDQESARKAFCEWVTRNTRLPSSHDFDRETASTPSLKTLMRLFGTGGVLKLSVEINRRCLDAGCRHEWQPGKPPKTPTKSL
jgi:hypothetical protein